LDTSTHPVHINEGFKCENCGKYTEKLQKTCRNHCKYCLFSRHVDKKTPGDRLSRCNGLMKPVEIISKSGKGSQIRHICIKCGKISLNKAANDDNVDTLITIMNSQNEGLIK
jgi:2-iminoacetate synthase ThiH